jgi:hypothetical protein
MKTTLKLVAVAVAVLGMASQSRADVLNFYLDISTPGTWKLSVSTDHTAGIGAFVVDLNGATTGTSVAIEGAKGGGIGATGYANGNIFQAGQPGINQAFAGQVTNGPRSGKVIEGLGFAPVADATVGSLINKGDGNGFNDSLPTVPGFQMLVYTGTGTPSFAATQPNDKGTLIGSVVDLGGGNTGYSTVAPTNVTYTVVPEPTAFVLAGLAIPALAYAIRRRKTAYGL